MRNIVDSELDKLLYDKQIAGYSPEIKQRQCTTIYKSNNNIFDLVETRMKIHHIDIVGINMIENFT